MHMYSTKTSFAPKDTFNGSLWPMISTCSLHEPLSRKLEQTGQFESFGPLHSIECFGIYSRHWSLPRIRDTWAGHGGSVVAPCGRLWRERHTVDKDIHSGYKNETEYTTWQGLSSLMNNKGPLSIRASWYWQGWGYIVNTAARVHKWALVLYVQYCVQYCTFPLFSWVIHEHKHFHPTLMKRIQKKRWIVSLIQLSMLSQCKLCRYHHIFFAMIRHSWFHPPPPALFFSLPLSLFRKIIQNTGSFMTKKRIFVNKRKWGGGGESPKWIDLLSSPCNRFSFWYFELSPHPTIWPYPWTGSFFLFFLIWTLTSN